MSSAAIQFRPATASDIGAVCRLLAELELPTAGVEEWWERFTLAESGREIVGVVGVETYPDGGLLRSVAVHPSMRGVGLGRALVERALQTARASGMRNVYLLTTTAETYFPRLGFARIGREAVPESVRASVEFRGACPASAVAMHLDMQR